MADRVETFAVGCSGGLVTNLPSLTQASQFSGTAIELENFEPTVEGGYRRINGYTKWNPKQVPLFHSLFTTDIYFSGTTTINVTNLFLGDNTLLSPGMTFTAPTFTSPTTVYTITGTSGYSSSTRSINITFTPGLAGLLNSGSRIEIASYLTKFLVVYRGYNTGAYAVGPYGKIYSSTNIAGTPLTRNGWTPEYIENGVTRVDGAGQTGTTLNVKGLRYTPKNGDNFVIGTGTIYTVQSSTASVNGTATLTILPALSSSPADSASISWRTSWASNVFDDEFVGDKVATRRSFVKYKKGVNERTAFGGNIPFILDWFGDIQIIPDIQDVKYVSHYKSTLFYSQNNELIFSAPYEDLNFNPGSGAGTIAFPDEITGLKALRDSLIVFCKSSIYRLTGSSQETFSTELVSSSIGCISHNTIKEISGDVIFLSEGGLCLLSDTEKTSGLGISYVSDKIKVEINRLVTPFAVPVSEQTYFNGVYFKHKNQYRVFQYDENLTTENSIGVVATKTERETSELSFSTLKGFRVFSVDHLDDATDNSAIPVENQSIFSTGADGYVYLMDNGNTFDGTNITATYSTPYYFFNDPKVRKAVLKLTLYTEPEGAVTTTIDTVLDYNKSDVIQPPSVVVGTTGTTYSDTTAPVFTTPLVGNGNSVSLKFTSNTNIPPYVIQSFTIEYSTNDRR